MGFQTQILYPYHFGKTDTAKLVSLLKDHPEIEVRIRRMGKRVGAPTLPGFLVLKQLTMSFDSPG